MSVEVPDDFSPPGEPRSPFTIVQSVSWSDIDAFGHVNHAVYLSWFENARFHYFELTGVSAYHASRNHGPILARITVDYRAPVRFPDELWVSMQVLRIGNTSFTTRNRVWSATQRRICAEAQAVIVMVDYGAEAAAVRVPEPIRAAMRAIEGIDLEPSTQSSGTIA
ncbi:MAG: thioesterase family protein [Nannocystaceae bacterium]